MASLNFDHLVEQYYEPLYRFALSLSQREADAADLTQQTFYRWATKGHQLRDQKKVKSWLFTTLHREFLGSRRRGSRFPHYEVDMVSDELPPIEPDMVSKLDSSMVMECMMRIDEIHRTPLTLFYLEEHSYQEIAEILQIPIGTVMSRLSRAKKLLKKLLQEAEQNAEKKVVEFRNETALKMKSKGGE